MPLPVILDNTTFSRGGAKDIDYTRDGEDVQYRSNWVVSGSKLPVQYAIENTKWPVNSEDAEDTITSVGSDNGFAEINLSAGGGFSVNDFVKIVTPVYNGVFRVRAVASATQFTIDTPFISTTTGTAQLSYNNYTTLIRIYAGFVDSHPLF